MMPEEMKYHRITVGDKKVCDDCKVAENLPARTLKEWDASGLKPRVLPTECNGKCRCGLAPSTIADIEKKVEGLIEKAAKEGFEQTVIDLTTGRTVLLKDFEQYEGMLTAQFQDIAIMENLIYEWKVANDGVKLPKEFFDQQDIYKMTDWLKDKVKPPKPPVKPIPKRPKPILKKFKKAKTIDEAENFARENFDIKADYSKMGAEKANVINEVLNKYFSKYPELKGKLKYISDLETSVSSIYAIYNYEAKRISFLSKQHISKSLETLNKEMQNNYKKGWSSFRGKNGFMGNVEHEFTHFLDDIFKFGQDKRIKRVLQKYNVNQISKGVGRYAATDQSEFIAECWVEYKQSPNPRKIPLEIGRIINKILGGK